MNRRTLSFGENNTERTEKWMFPSFVRKSDDGRIDVTGSRRGALITSERYHRKLSHSHTLTIVVVVYLSTVVILRHSDILISLTTIPKYLQSRMGA